MTKIIGLTGGIATGKSTVSKMFKDAGLPVIDSDAIAKTLLEKDQTAYHEVVKLLGADILSTDQTINRKKLAKIIFKDAKLRQNINNIIHPKVIEIIKQEINRLTTYEAALIVIDVPLLFETGFEKYCDSTVLVYARKKDQLARLIRRDQIDESYALEKIEAQMPMSKKRAKADYTIDNTKSILETKKAFERLMKKLQS